MLLAHRTAVEAASVASFLILPSKSFCRGMPVTYEFSWDKMDNKGALEVQPPEI